MSAEADITFLVEQTGVVLVVESVRIGVATVGSHIVTLASLTDVTVENNLAINRYGDMIANSLDFLATKRAMDNPLKKHGNIPL